MSVKLPKMCEFAITGFELNQRPFRTINKPKRNPPRGDSLQHCNKS